MIIQVVIFRERFSLSFVLLVQQQQRPPSSHHTPRLHPTLRLHHTPRSYTKLATTPPPRHTPPTALAIKRAPCGHTPRGTDGDAAWPRRDFPPKRPRGPPHPNAHHLPVSEARKGRGEGWRVLPIGGHGCNAPRRGRGAERGRKQIRVLGESSVKGRVEKRTQSTWREFCKRTC